MLAGVQLDVDHLREILEIVRLLAVTDDLDALLHRIASAATSLLKCERASIFVHDPDDDTLWTRVAIGTGTIRVPRRSGIVGACFSENMLIRAADAYTDPRFNPEPDRQSGFRTRDIIAAPMVDLTRKPIGVVEAINKRDGSFTEIDAALLQLLADQSGVALQRYRLQQHAMQLTALHREMDLAKEVQVALLPKHPVRTSNFIAQGWTRPASITGGDGFDLWKTDDGRLGIFVADASGHGLAPALVISQVRALVRTIADGQPQASPQEILSRVNARLRADLEAGRFVTAFLGFLSDDGQMEWASGGHGPILFRPDAASAWDKVPASTFPLGVLHPWYDPPPPPAHFGPGGALVIISDGIFEAIDLAGHQFGITRVTDCLDAQSAHPPARAIDTLRQAVESWQTTPDPRDDQTIVVVKRSGDMGA